VNLCAAPVSALHDECRGLTRMYTSAEATQPIAGSLSAFLDGPDVNRDLILSELLKKADALPGCTFLVFDFLNRSSVHIGSSIYDLTGYLPEEAGDGGADFIAKVTNPADLPYMMLVQAGYIQQAKSAGFDLCSLRFNDYYWSIVRKDGRLVPMISTGIVLTYTTQNDFRIGVGFHVQNDSEGDAQVMRCKEYLMKIKQRHNEVYRHVSASQDSALYLIQHVSALSETITQRERQVLGMLAQGHSTDAIAATLHIAVNTVESHRKKLLQKFDARNAAELIKKASKIFWLS
jgi:DNA-binding CsgD family transcriptional regulator